jgi:hypothetical protein
MAIEDFFDVLNKVNDVQEGQDLTCNCTECYWNMYHPTSKYHNNERAKTCVSESLADFKMKPNNEDCPGYWSYEDACGHKKEDSWQGFPRKRQ